MYSFWERNPEKWKTQHVFPIFIYLLGLKHKIHQQLFFYMSFVDDLARFKQKSAYTHRFFAWIRARLADISRNNLFLLARFPFFGPTIASLCRAVISILGNLKSIPRLMMLLLMSTGAVQLPPVLRALEVKLQSFLKWRRKRVWTEETTGTEGTGEAVEGSTPSKRTSLTVSMTRPQPLSETWWRTRNTPRQRRE